MARARRKKKYVVKRTENRYGCGKTRPTWDVLESTREGFDHLAECVRRNHAIILAKALNGGVVR